MPSAKTNPCLRYDDRNQYNTSIGGTIPLFARIQRDTFAVDIVGGAIVISRGTIILNARNPPPLADIVAPE